jgi:hypothetical protein
VNEPAVAYGYIGVTHADDTTIGNLIVEILDYGEAHGLRVDTVYVDRDMAPRATQRNALFDLLDVTRDAPEVVFVIVDADHVSTNEDTAKAIIETMSDNPRAVRRTRQPAEGG